MRAPAFCMFHSRHAHTRIGSTAIRSANGGVAVVSGDRHLPSHHCHHDIQVTLRLSTPPRRMPRLPRHPPPLCSTNHYALCHSRAHWLVVVCRGLTSHMMGSLIDGHCCLMPFMHTCSYTWFCTHFLRGEDSFFVFPHQMAILGRHLTLFLCLNCCGWSLLPGNGTSSSFNIFAFYAAAAYAITHIVVSAHLNITLYLMFRVIIPRLSAC